ncbi:hypothetical protein [uncultured Sulfitobacter sp.]|uniref:hypothetical protein n=1 Tax=uncultured Sulfitobacter sp. TaxID=191468 RepID=UPI0030DB3369|tara:strand:+ start:3873 stop:4247 length:375 start_codon:yes stop_codon:yes gene_type:complete
MLSQKDIYKKTYAVRRQLDEKLGVRGRDLGHAVRKAGRRLPVAIRVQAGTLAEAEFFAENPKMARRLDGPAMQAAFDSVMAYLRGIDVAEARKDRILGIAGSVGFNLLFVAVAFIAFLWWRGYV